MSTIKKIDKHSVEGFETSLSIFDLPPSNVSINRSANRELLPLSAITQDGPYVFRLFADNQFVDLNKTWLYLELSIEKKDPTGTWMGLAVEDKCIGVCQNIGQSFVRQLKLSLNNTECFDSGVLYAYRAYILHELGHSNDTKKGLFEACGYFPDDNNQNSATGSGYTARCKQFSNGSLYRTMAKLDFDLARQESFILNNTDIIFTLYRNTDDFLLLALDPTDSIGQYRLAVHSVKLYVKTVDVTQSLNNAISRHLEKNPAKYAVRKIEVRSVFLGKGRTEIAHNIFTSVIPRRIIIGFVSNDAFSGRRNLSPFVFEHAKLRSLTVEANGLSYPSAPYDLDFDKGNYVRAFVDMYTGLGYDNGDNTCSISMYRFKMGWCFFVIPMTATLEDTPGFELIKNGTTCIKATFNEPIKDMGYEMIVLAEFDQVITINSDRVFRSDGTI